MGVVLAGPGQHVYQRVCAGSVVSVLAFAVTKGFTFTETTLMASSWLHDHVFDKVQFPGAVCLLVHLSTGFIEHLQRARHCARLRGQTRGSWRSQPSLGRLPRCTYTVKANPGECGGGVVMGWG